MDIKITFPSKDDWEIYRDLTIKSVENAPASFGASLEEVKQRSKEDWKKHLGMNFEKDSHTFLFAVDRDTPIGMVGAFVHSAWNMKHIARLYRVFVLPEYRGQGIASVLLERVLEEIKKNKEVIGVKLKVNCNNGPAMKLYEKFGFREYGIDKKELKVNGEYYDFKLMELFFEEVRSM